MCHLASVNGVHPRAPRKFKLKMLIYLSKLDNFSCIVLGSGFLLRSTSSFHGLVPTAIHGLVRFLVCCALISSHYPNYSEAA